MITVCSVILQEIEPYLPIFEESISTRTKFVSEVLIASPDRHTTYSQIYEKNNIKFHRFGTMEHDRFQQGIEHGIGLHACIEKSKNEYLMFCDPDIFFYRPVDELYLNLMKKYKLNIIGISHSSAAKFVYTYFPNVMNLMVKKSDLPDENFMKDRVNGKWLTRAELFDLAGNFPNPKGEFDTGCFLCYWAILNNWKWLSFQTQDIHTYCPIQNRGNVKPEKLDKEKMLYHATSSTCPTGWNERFQAFKEAWEQ